MLGFTATSFSRTPSATSGQADGPIYFLPQGETRVRRFRAINCNIAGLRIETGPPTPVVSPQSRDSMARLLIDPSHLVYVVPGDRHGRLVLVRVKPERT
jgi:hypothetical protein